MQSTAFGAAVQQRLKDLNIAKNATITPDLADHNPEALQGLVQAVHAGGLPPETETGAKVAIAHAAIANATTPLQPASFKPSRSTYLTQVKSTAANSPIHLANGVIQQPTRHGSTIYGRGGSELVVSEFNSGAKQIEYTGHDGQHHFIAGLNPDQLKNAVKLFSDKDGDKLSRFMTANVERPGPNLERDTLMASLSTGAVPDRVIAGSSTQDAVVQTKLNDTEGDVLLNLRNQQPAQAKSYSPRI